MPPQFFRFRRVKTFRFKREDLKVFFSSLVRLSEMISTEVPFSSVTSDKIYWPKPTLDVKCEAIISFLWHAVRTFYGQLKQQRNCSCWIKQWSRESLKSVENNAACILNDIWFKNIGKFISKESAVACEWSRVHCFTAL